MFSELSGEYKAQVIWYWQKYLNNKLMIIDTLQEPKVVLAKDPYEARFFLEEPLALDKVLQDPEPPHPSPKLPISKDISMYVIFFTQNL